MKCVVEVVAVESETDKRVAIATRGMLRVIIVCSIASQTLVEGGCWCCVVVRRVVGGQSQEFGES